MSLPTNYTDSDAYQAVDLKCIFCHEKFTKRDTLPPHKVLQGLKSKTFAHFECVQYAKEKYPDTPLSLLEGKITRPPIWRYVVV